MTATMHMHKQEIKRDIIYILFIKSRMKMCIGGTKVCFYELYSVQTTYYVPLTLQLKLVKIVWQAGIRCSFVTKRMSLSANKDISSQKIVQISPAHTENRIWMKNNKTT